VSGALQTIESPPQPASIFPPDSIDEMRLEIFDSFPDRHIAYAVHDHSCMPMVGPGEVLVVTDQPRLYPQERQWYLIQWIRPPYNEWERPSVHQTIGIPRKLKDDKWAYGPPCQRWGGVMYCGDGYFTWEKMTDYIRGAVVGIYRPGGRPTE
jgi:hypothetical protein